MTVGACAFSIISDLVFRGPDNTRIASGVVEGIGFLGAGIIIRGRAGIHGLTTAATLWASAAVGMLIGFGLNVYKRQVAGGVAVNCQPDGSNVEDVA